MTRETQRLVRSLAERLGSGTAGRKRFRRDVRADSSEPPTQLGPAVTVTGLPGRKSQT